MSSRWKFLLKKKAISIHNSQRSSWTSRKVWDRVIRGRGPLIVNVSIIQRSFLLLITATKCRFESVP